jgi:hypothetical protein
MENTETQIWLDFAFSCKYIDEELHTYMMEKSLKIGSYLGYMIKNPEKFT